MLSYLRRLWLPAGILVVAQVVGCSDFEGIVSEDENRTYTSGSKIQCVGAEPRHLLKLNPDDAVTIQRSEDRLIVRALHYYLEADSRVPATIYSVDLCGEDPQLLSTDLEDVLVLSNGTVLGYYWESYSLVGSAYILDPYGRSAPTLFAANIFPTGMFETPYGLITTAVDENTGDTYSVRLLIFPFTESGMAEPKMFDFFTEKFGATVTGDERHLAVMEFADISASKRLFTIDLSTLEASVIGEDVAFVGVAPVGANIAWGDNSDRLYGFNPMTGMNLLLSDNFQEGSQNDVFGSTASFTLDGGYVFMPRPNRLIEFATGISVKLPPYAMYDEEIGLTDGVEMAFYPLEDGSIMLGTGKDPLAVNWSRYVPRTGESIPLFGPMQVLSDFAFQEGFVYGLSPFELYGEEGPLRRTSPKGGENIKVAEPVDVDYQWAGPSQLLTHTDLEEFRFEYGGNSSYISMEKGNLKFIDANTGQAFLLDKQVNASCTTVFLDQKFIAYVVANHDNPDKSGVYTIGLP